MGENLKLDENIKLYENSEINENWKIDENKKINEIRKKRLGQKEGEVKETCRNQKKLMATGWCRF